MVYVAHMHNIEPDHQELLSTAEVARILETTPATINRWASSGRLPVAVKAPGPRGARMFSASIIEQIRGESTSNEVPV